MAIKTFDQRVREAIGQQAWNLLLQQQQIDELTEKLAALTPKAAEPAVMPSAPRHRPKPPESA